MIEIILYYYLPEDPRNKNFHKDIRELFQEHAIDVASVDSKFRKRPRQLEIKVKARGSLFLSSLQTAIASVGLYLDSITKKDTPIGKGSVIIKEC